MMAFKLKENSILQAVSGKVRTDVLKHKNWLEHGKTGVTKFTFWMWMIEEEAWAL